MADSSGVKRSTGAGVEEPPSKRQATEGGTVKSEPGGGGPASAMMAAELKRKVSEALAKRKQLLELELAHLESGGSLLDWTASMVGTLSLCPFYAPSARDPPPCPYILR